MNMTKSSLLGKKTNGHNHNDSKCNIAKHVAMISHMNTIIMIAIAKHHKKKFNFVVRGNNTIKKRIKTKAIMENIMIKKRPKSRASQTTS